MDMEIKMNLQPRYTPADHYKSVQNTVFNGIKILYQDKNNKSVNFELTKMERRVAKTMLIYDEAKLAAAHLNTSSRTVEFHCSNIRRKVGESKTLKAIRRLLELGLLD